MCVCVCVILCVCLCVCVCVHESRSDVYKIRHKPVKTDVFFLHQSMFILLSDAPDVDIVMQMRLDGKAQDFMPLSLIKVP